MNAPITEEDVQNWIRDVLVQLTARGWTVQQIDHEVGDRTGKECRDVLRRLLDAETRPPHQSEAVTVPAAAGTEGVKGEVQPPPASATATPERANLEAVAETVGVAGPVEQRDGSGDAANTNGEIGRMSQIGQTSRRRPAARKRWAGLSSVQIRVRVAREFGDALLAMPAKSRARAVAHLLMANAVGVDLAKLGAPELRLELARANANLNQSLRHFHFGEGDGDLVLKLRELVALFDRLQCAGALST